jgi:hypothetical protein
MLQKHFTFYAMTPKGNVDAEAFFRENFKDVIGRVYSPYRKRNGFDYYALAASRHFWQNHHVHV